MGAIKRSKNQELATTNAVKSSGRDKQKGRVNLMNRRRRDPYNLQRVLLYLRVRRRRKENFAATIPKVFIPKKMS